MVESRPASSLAGRCPPRSQLLQSPSKKCKLSPDSVVFITPSANPLASTADGLSGEELFSEADHLTLKRLLSSGLRCSERSLIDLCELCL